MRASPTARMSLSYFLARESSVGKIISPGRYRNGARRPDQPNSHKAIFSPPFSPSPPSMAMLSVVEPSLKVMVTVDVPLPGATAETVAVKVTW